MSDIFDRLREKFDDSDIDQLPRTFHKGKSDERTILLNYVGHAAVTDRLIGVDPEGWRWEPYAVDETGLPRIVRRGDGLELWIRLTVGGKTLPGVGTVPVEYDRDSGEELPADETTAKELIGDAIRNAAMRFGVGLDLWRKHGPAEAAPSGPPCPHCGTPVRFNEEKTRGRKPVWSCPNFGCGGGAAKKEGGNWPWGSYNPNEFREEGEDAVGNLRQAGLIGEPAPVSDEAKAAMSDLTITLESLGVSEDQARAELEACALNPRFAAGSIRQIRSLVDRALALVIAIGLEPNDVLPDLWAEWQGDDDTRADLTWATIKGADVQAFAKFVQGYLRGLLAV